MVYLFCVVALLFCGVLVNSVVYMIIFVPVSIRFVVMFGCLF